MKAGSGTGKNLVVAAASSEMVPYAKVGGLADVAGTLPCVLSKEGVTYYSFLPAYRTVKSRWFSKAKRVAEFSVSVAGHDETARIWRFGDGKRHAVFFVEHDGYFDRPEIYGDAQGDYPDNWARFSFFSQAVLEMFNSPLLESPDVIHVHDWQTALMPVYIRERYRSSPPLSGARTLLTLHNIAYQGQFNREVLPSIGLGWNLFNQKKLEFWGKVNFLKGGIVYADALNTVSPTYAVEIQTDEYGAGMDGVLRERKGSLSGILNGIDVSEWDPSADAHLWKTYSAQDPKGKADNKSNLQKLLGLEMDDRLMLIGMVARLVDQKGVDIILQALPDLLKQEIQVVILGNGNPGYEESLVRMARAHSEQLAVKIAFDDQLAHRIYAGSDVFLMPSRFEPCGLGQLISFRYGTVPVARRTGGLADTVIDAGEDTEKGNGFIFSTYTARGLVHAVCRALEAYRSREQWNSLIRRIMKLDFSWNRSARAYVDLYKSVIARSHAGGMV